jgi:large subunit ribosomal protein L19
MEAIRQLESKYRKPSVPQVQSGDTVRVHQVIREGNKQRVQVFEGVIIRRHRLNEVSACITVRRIASGVGVEKTFLLHSPNVSKIEIVRRAKVRRNFLSYLRNRRGKSARLQELSFDKAAANVAEAKPSDESIDEAVTEVDVDESQDALDEAVSINPEVNSENRQAAAEDDAPNTPAGDNADEQLAEVDEVDQGLDKAEPGEGDAVTS